MTIAAIDVSGSGIPRELHSIEREHIETVAALNRGCQRHTMVFQSLLKSICIQEHFIEKQVSPVAPPSCVSSLNPQPPELVSHDDVNVANQVVVEHAESTPSVDDFITSIWPYARHAARALGLDPTVLIAQAVLETGWGKAIAKDGCGTSNNVFNIKARSTSSDKTLPIKTTEYIADAPTTVMASFKKYPSIEHSFNDYVSLIKNNDRYRQAVVYAHDAERYIEAIHQAGYATDPQYANKLLSIYRGNQLRQALERNGCVGTV